MDLLRVSKVIEFAIVCDYHSLTLNLDRVRLARKFGTIGSRQILQSNVEIARRHEYNNCIVCFRTFSCRGVGQVRADRAF